MLLFETRTFNTNTSQWLICATLPVTLTISPNGEIPGGMTSGIQDANAINKHLVYSINVNPLNKCNFYPRQWQLKKWRKHLL